MRRLLIFLSAALLAIPLAGCVGSNTRAQAVKVRSDGTQSAGVISALDAMPGETGPQEIIGINIPFVGTGLALKAGLIWDGAPGVITIPVGQAAPAPYAADACAGPQFVEVQETYMEPETRMVPRTRTVRRAVVPIPQAIDPCGRPVPAPQAAPMQDPCAPQSQPQKAPLQPQVVPSSEPAPAPPVASLEDPCSSGSCKVPK